MKVARSSLGRSITTGLGEYDRGGSAMVRACVLIVGLQYQALVLAGRGAKADAFHGAVPSLLPGDHHGGSRFVSGRFGAGCGLPLLHTGGRGRPGRTSRQPAPLAARRPLRRPPHPPPPGGHPAGDPGPEPPAPPPVAPGFPVWVALRLDDCWGGPRAPGQDRTPPRSGTAPAPSPDRGGRCRCAASWAPVPLPGLHTATAGALWRPKPAWRRGAVG